MTPVLIMWIHLVAAMTWVGGMLFQWLVLRDVALGTEVLRQIEGRFRSVRWISLLVLLFTGILNLMQEGGSARLESSWGGILMIKLLLVAVAFGLTGVNDFLIHSNPGQPTSGPSTRIKYTIHVMILIVGLLIVFVAVYLGRS